MRETDYVMRKFLTFHARWRLMQRGLWGDFADETALFSEQRPQRCEEHNAQEETCEQGLAGGLPDGRALLAQQVFVGQGIGIARQQHAYLSGLLIRPQQGRGGSGRGNN